MLFQHDPSQPIGVWTEIKEDARGLLVRGQLAKDVGRAREVLSLMRGGALDGLSIGFRTVRARSEAGTGVRRVLEADLWEISVVTFPMLPEARIHAVKSVTGAPLPTIREFERWLTRDAGLTRGDAQAVIAKGFARLKRERDAAQALPGRSPERIPLAGPGPAPFTGGNSRADNALVGRIRSAAHLLTSFKGKTPWTNK